MPNWTQNTLIISVPTEKANALLEALKGPADWVVPMTEEKFFKKPISAHEEVARKALLLNDPESTRTAYRTDPLNAGRPDWMPISSFDIISWNNTKNGIDDPSYLRADEKVPFSVAKLCPLPGKEVFDMLFPGIIDENGYWEQDPNADRAYSSGNKGYIALRNHFLGIKWPPGDIELRDVFPVEKTGRTIISISYQTPWAPITDPRPVLEGVLEDHGAKALITWEEEDQNSGFFVLNPLDDVWTEHTYEHGQFTSEIVYDEGTDDEETYHEWDSEKFFDDVQSLVDDPDFF